MAHLIQIYEHTFYLKALVALTIGLRLGRAFVEEDTDRVFTVRSTNCIHSY